MKLFIGCMALLAATVGCPADNDGSSANSTAGNATIQETPASPAQTDIDAKSPADEQAASGESAASNAPTAQQQDNESTKPANPSKPMAQSFPHSGLSNAGAYRIDYRTDPEPLPLNQMFRVYFQVFDANDESRPVTDAEVLVDAAMPAHGHGMNTLPVVTAGEGGVYEVAGMLFHMSGHWELYFDVTRNGITERAQFDINLE